MFTRFFLKCVSFFLQSSLRSCGQWWCTWASLLGILVDFLPCQSSLPSLLHWQCLFCWSWKACLPSFMLLDCTGKYTHTMLALNVLRAEYTLLPPINGYMHTAEIIPLYWLFWVLSLILYTQSFIICMCENLILQPNSLPEKLPTKFLLSPCFKTKLNK